MPEPRLYLVGCRDSFIVPKRIEDELDRLVADSHALRQVRRLSTGQRVIEMPERDASALSEQREHLLIEEDQTLLDCSPVARTPTMDAEDAGRRLAFRVVDERSGEPVEGATVRCRSAGTEYAGLTDAAGRVTIAAGVACRDVVATAPAGYWSKRLPLAGHPGQETVVGLKPLVVAGAYGWGHLAVRADKVSARFTGRGVKLALVGGGVAAHPDLKIAGALALGDVARGDGVGEETGQGTHCWGLVSAQGEHGRMVGLAPDADVWGLRVLPDGRLSALLEAIDWCVENYVDVMGVCVGLPRRSVHLDVALEDAAAHGVTTVVGAGDDGQGAPCGDGPSRAMVVSAVGRMGVFPADSVHALAAGPFSHDRRHFLPRSARLDARVDLCAPGVAVVSTVPGGYAARDGTAAACAFVTGGAALVLEAYRELRRGDEMQPARVRDVLMGSAVRLGLPAEGEGAGMMNVGIALQSAFCRR